MSKPRFSAEQSFVNRLDALRREFTYSRGGGRLQFDAATRAAIEAMEKATYAYRRANPFCEHCGATGEKYASHWESPCSGLREAQRRDEECESRCDAAASRAYEVSAYGRD